MTATSVFAAMHAAMGIVPQLLASKTRQAYDIASFGHALKASLSRSLVWVGFTTNPCIVCTYVAFDVLSDRFASLCACHIGNWLLHTLYISGPNLPIPVLEL